MRAVHLTSYGDPANGLKFVEIPEPKAPGEGEVLIQVELAPLNVSDLLLAKGAYFVRPELPSVVGNEGSGVVIALGKGVSNVKIGDRVNIPPETFTYAERVVAPAKNLFVIDPKIDAEQAAMIKINPVTAVLLLSEFVKLEKGSWVAFNSANSGVGRSLIALAKSRGIHTVCIVRRPELIPELEALGADFVALESPDLPKQVQLATGGEPIMLGLDGLGGASTDALSQLLAVNSQLVGYASMSGQPIRFNQGILVGKKMILRGFWMYYEEFRTKLIPSLEVAAKLMASGALKLPINEIYPPEKIKDAVEHLQRGGKILLDFRRNNHG